MSYSPKGQGEKKWKQQIKYQNWRQKWRWARLNVEYDEGSEDEDIFVEMTIVNPENSERKIDAYVPASMAEGLEAEAAIGGSSEILYVRSKTWEWDDAGEEKIYTPDSAEAEAEAEVKKHAEERMEDYPGISGYSFRELTEYGCEDPGNSDYWISRYKIEYTFDFE